MKPFAVNVFGSVAVPPGCLPLLRRSLAGWEVSRDRSPFSRGTRTRRRAPASGATRPQRPADPTGTFRGSMDDSADETIPW